MVHGVNGSKEQSNESTTEKPKIKHTVLFVNICGAILYYYVKPIFTKLFHCA